MYYKIIKSIFIATLIKLKILKIRKNMEGLLHLLR
jgi:hypothetical protein